MKRWILALLLLMYFPDSLKQDHEYEYGPTLEEIIEELQPPQDILVVEGPYETWILRWYGPDCIKRITIYHERR